MQYILISSLNAFGISSYLLFVGFNTCYVDTDLSIGFNVELLLLLTYNGNDVGKTEHFNPAFKDYVLVSR